ncbi:MULTISPECIES: reprolysin-like metallopeptidase [Flavobacterium]|uniref:zinc-dependent metalloprotease n=1 Tax=Flavobacterium TaxID=237 RepID=UPI001FCCA19F|nr:MULTISPECIES: zinc-dependent metalloprotease family protein [Flavobacterium]UOK42989.1 proprotein convertase P-domain-containing protein [Flavobacterium enshiense]
MKRILLCSLIAFIGSLSAEAQTDKAWQRNSGEKIVASKNVKRLSFPKKFDLYDLNINPIRETLFSIVDKSSKHSVIISLPNTKGQMEQFEMYEASNFEPDLQAQYPQIRAFSGKGITDSYATIKLSISPQGIQTMVFRSDNENEFMEPYSVDGETYAVFNSQRERGQLSWTCSTDDHGMMTDIDKQLPSTNKSSAGQLKTIRLAQSCNGEYAAYFGASTAGNDADKALVLAAFNATLTRCNGIYERDLALHLNLIASTTNVIYCDPASDPYSTNLGQWNAQLQNTLSTNLTGPSTSLAENNAAYDIGHMFGASGGGGNAGCIGCVCVDDTSSASDLNKGAGITSPADGVPMGDNFDIDYVVHEIGHQLGGNHTFSISNEGTGVNKEVGSGVTIMGYAGITNQDVAPHSIAIYHQASIAQIQATLAGKTCPATTSLAGNNAAPVVNAGPDYTIPKSTPFILTGSATDADAGDALTYCWEQNDNAGIQTGASSVASTSKNSGPNWRSWNPTTSPIRYMPILSTVIANRQTTAGTGDETINVEALSSVARTLNFRLTVRDNVPYSSTAPIKVGQTNYDDMRVVVNGTAGPFTVSVPNTAVSWVAGTNQTVTWNVAGTTANGVNCNYVDIYLSTDGGNTYPILLASKVPNDGSETITVPNNTGTTNRIMVKGNNHIFYDISNNNFTITAPTSSFSVGFNGVAGQQFKSVCQGGTTSYSIDYKVFGGFSATTTFSATSTPTGLTVTFAPTSMSSSNGTVTMTVSNTAGKTPGVYKIVAKATSGTTSKTVPYYLELLNAAFPAMSLTTPANNAVGQNMNLSLKWVTNSNASSYDVQVATDLAFTNIISSGNATTTSYNVSGLSQATNYYWRVAPKNNGCTGTYSSAFKFTTGTLSCATVNSTNIPVTIPDNTTATSTITIANGGIISDVNITLNVSHSWIGDTDATLTSPAGTIVKLFDRPCDSAASGNENANATFDDSGAIPVCPGLTGTVIPTSPLSAFNGQTSTGIWTLKVTDRATNDSGTLNSWNLNICTVQTAGVTDNTIKNFTLYPNPNNGNFKVQFESSSSNDIKINIHDISGRLIFEKSYQNNGYFSQNIQLNNTQTGVYLISVLDGDKQTTKRIIIK